jgi:hypothetical protein
MSNAMTGRQRLVEHRVCWTTVSHWNVPDTSLKHVERSRAYLTTITTAGVFVMVPAREQSADGW